MVKLDLLHPQPEQKIGSWSIGKLITMTNLRTGAVIITCAKTVKI